MKNIKYFRTLAETMFYGATDEIKNIKVEPFSQYILIGEMKNGKIINPTLNISKVINGEKMYSQTIIDFDLVDLMNQLKNNKYKSYTNFSELDGHIEAIETWSRNNV